MADSGARRSAGEALARALRRTGAAVHRDHPLAGYTTYAIGGPAEVAVLPRDADQLAAVVQTLDRARTPWVVLGGGSNVLISDAGVRGAVVITTGLDRLQTVGPSIVAGAGVQSHAIAEAALEAELQGAEFLAWLPGSLGGACLMNARAHGGEIARVLTRATVVTRAGQRRELALSPDQFAYKRSPFQRSGDIIAEAALSLDPGERGAIRARMEAIEARRRANHEMDHPSCGCVFKNNHDIGVSSGKLIDACGLKGFRVGAAEVSPHHANFVLNRGGATAADVRRVIEHMRAEVARQTGWELELEVQLLGQW